MYCSLYNWIGEHEITKLKKYIFASNPEKRTQKQAQKDINGTEWNGMEWNGMEWNGMTQNGLFDIFRNAHA